MTKEELDAKKWGQTSESNTTPAPTATAKPYLSESYCKQVATKYLKDALKNPESLQIHSVTCDVDQFNYTFTFDISAMNGFGGYNRTTYVCSVNHLTGIVTSAYYK